MVREEGRGRSFPPITAAQPVRPFQQPVHDVCNPTQIRSLRPNVSSKVSPSIPSPIVLNRASRRPSTVPRSGRLQGQHARAHEPVQAAARPLHSVPSPRDGKVWRQAGAPHHLAHAWEQVVHAAEDLLSHVSIEYARQSGVGARRVRRRGERATWVPTTTSRRANVAYKSALMLCSCL